MATTPGQLEVSPLQRRYIRPAAPTSTGVDFSGLMQLLGPLVLGMARPGAHRSGAGGGWEDIMRKLVESEERARAAGRGAVPTGTGVGSAGVEDALRRAWMARIVAILQEAAKRGGSMPGLFPLFLNPQHILPPNLQGTRG